MSEIINTAAIGVVIDATGVEVGMRKIEDAAAKTGRTLDNLGKGDGFKQLGAGSEDAASRIDKATKQYANYLQRVTAEMAAGTKGSREYILAMAAYKGADLTALKPFIDQLDAVTKKTAQAAEAQRKLDESMKFLAALSGRTEGIGKTASQLAELRAAELGVSAAAAPMIAKMREAEEAAKGVGSTLSGVGGVIGKFSGLLGALGIGLSVGAFAGMAKGAIDAADNLNDLSKSTSIAVGDLAGLQLAAKKSGGDLEGIAGSINKLSVNIAKEPEKFRQLGISAKEPLEAFKQLADVFVAIKDPQLRAAFGAEALGKSWASAAPLLAEGGEKIGELVAKGRELSGMTQEMADASDAFNDRMVDLGAAVDGAKVKIVGGMLPGLIDASNAITKAFEESGKLEAAWIALGALGAFAFTDEFSTAEVKLKNLRGELDVLKNYQLNAKESVPILGYLLWGSEASWDADIASKKKDIADFIEETKRQAKVASETRESEKKKEEEKRSADAAASKFLALGKAASDKAAALIEKEASAYAGLTSSINERIAASAREAAGLAPLTEAQKLQVSLDEQLRSGKLKLTDSHKAHYEQQIRDLEASDLVIASQKRAAIGAAASAKIFTEYQQTVVQAATDAAKEADKNELLARTFGMTKGAIELLELARLEEQLAQRTSTGLTIDEIGALEKLIGAKKRSASAAVELDGLTGAKKASDELDKFLDPEKAQSFGDALKDAFGGAESAIVKMTNALGDFGKRQEEINKQKGNAALAYMNGLSDETKYAKQIADLNEMNTRNQLSGYGDMASAAAGFFGEQSTGYRALTAASQVFHAAELAMTLAELVPKGISAVLGQGQGDPYSAFARMAAMGAIVTGLGVAIGGIGGGGSGGKSAADMQKAQGVGGVFGDSTGKSDSINRALDLIEENTYQGLDYSAGMLDALRNIETSMVGLNNLLVRSTGVMDGSNFGIQTGQLNIGKPTDGISSAMTQVTKGLFGPGLGDKIASFVNNLWGKTTQSIVDSGIQFGGSLSDLQKGAGYQQYASVDKTKSSFFGLVKNTSNSVQVQGLSEELSSQFGMIFTGLEDTLKSAAIGLGLNASQVTDALSGLVIEDTKLSLKGLSGDELTSAINAVISKAMDQVSEAAFPSFDAFRKIGEGYSETVIRIANDFQAIDTVFGSIGKTFGQIGLESIAARERLIDLSGGLDKFASQGEFFLKNFFTETEQAASLKARIQPTLDQFGLKTEGRNATSLFKDVVVGLDTTTEAGSQAYVALMKIAPAFMDIIKAASGVQEECKSLQDQLDQLTLSPEQLIAKDRSKVDPSNQGLFDDVQAATAKNALAEVNRGFQQQIDDFLKLSMSAAEVRALETAGMDASTTALYDRLAGLKTEATAQATAKANVETARGALSTAYQRESGKWESMFSESVARAASLRSQNAALLTGSMSPLSGASKLAMARDQFNSATGNDKGSSGSALLQAAQASGISRVEYAKIFSQVQTGINREAILADIAADYSKQQLAALETQVAGLISLNESTISVKDAVAALKEANSAASIRQIDISSQQAATLTTISSSVQALRQADESPAAIAAAQTNALLARLLEAIENGNKDGSTVAETLLRVTSGGVALKTVGT